MHLQYLRMHMSECPELIGQPHPLRIKRYVSMYVSMGYLRIAVHIWDHFTLLNFTWPDHRDVSRVPLLFLEPLFRFQDPAGTEEPKPVCRPLKGPSPTVTSTPPRGWEGAVEDSGGTTRWRRGSCLRFGLSPLTHFPTSSTSREFPTAISSPSFSVKINGVNPDLLATWM